MKNSGKVNTENNTSEANFATDTPSDSSTDLVTPNDTQPDTSSFTNEPANLQVLLVYAMNMVSDNEAIEDIIAEVLNATVDI